jgi:hypothetical protein
MQGYDYAKFLQEALACEENITKNCALNFSKWISYHTKWSRYMLTNLAEVSVAKLGD